MGLLKFLKNKYYRWNIIPCPKCGCKETKVNTVDWINHMACESEILCADCGYLANYWAYGNYEFPNTKTEYFWWRLYYIKLRIERWNDEFRLESKL